MMTAPLRDRGASNRVADALAGLPPGTVDLGCRCLAGGAELAHTMTDQRVASDPATVEAHLVRPLLLVDDWPDPTDPLPVGAGAVHADLIDEDREALARLRATFSGAADPERLAAEAQAWRLPVTPYRPAPRPDRKPATIPRSGRRRSPAECSGRRPLAGRLVVDLSALWAGPLATSLLAALGARVVKVDPECRPDGFREHAALYDHLNGAKEIIDLDLRDDRDRRRFEQLVVDADLVIDSFSRRVMPNLGYGPDRLRQLNPSVGTLSIVAFPLTSPEAEWVSYGPGVHATSGLAALGRSEGATPVRYRPAPIAYPDVLAGLAAFAAAVELFATVGPLPHRELSLLGAIEPLVEARRAQQAQSSEWECR